MEVIYELSENQIKDLHGLYENEWWTNTRSLAQTKNCVEGSQLCIGLVENDKLIGFVRVITDFTFKALIFDLIIKNEYQRKKLGQKLMHLVKSHEKLKNIIHFELYCLPELKGFYKQFNFSEEIGGVELLRCNNA
jgi:predicted GNAT family N-acyltransferase